MTASVDEFALSGPPAVQARRPVFAADGVFVPGESPLTVGVFVRRSLIVLAASMLPVGGMFLGVFLIVHG